MMLIKVFAAFGVGVAALAGLQTYGLRSLQQHLKSDQARAGMPPIGKSPDFAKNFEASGFRNALHPGGGRIDTREGQRLADRGRGAKDRPAEPRRAERGAVAAAHPHRNPA